MASRAVQSELRARAPADPLLAEIKAQLQALYGDRLREVRLYGSRARGDHRAESDYDVAVILHAPPGQPLDRPAERRRLGELSWRLWDRFEAQVHFVPLDEAGLAERTIFTHELRTEGVAL